MTEEELKNALAALKPQTRKQIVFELNSALIDTMVEFDKVKDSSIRDNLCSEVKGLTRLKDVVESVSREFDEICQKRSSSS